MVEEDPFQVVAAITRTGLCDDLAMEILKGFTSMHHLPTGLSPVALAAAATHLPLVRRMLQSECDFLAGNEWGITPLLAMAAHPLPAAPSAAEAALTATPSSSSLSFSCFRRSSEASAVDSGQAALVRLFLRVCDERDAAAAAAPAATAAAVAAAAALAEGGVQGTTPAASAVDGGDLTAEKRRLLTGGPTCRELFLQARTHRLLGLNTALHLAAARGKKELCKQLLRSGQNCFAANGEGATPVHLAALAADAATVRVLLDYAVPTSPGKLPRISDNNNDPAVEKLVNARTERGETALMHAAYGLQPETVSLLLERGADVNAIAHREGLTAFHALAVGVCRDYEVQQQPLDLRGDAAAAALVGANDYSLSAGIYTRSNMPPVSPLLDVQQLENIVDLRVPLVSRLPADLLLFPQQLLLRLTHALAIAQQLVSAPCRSSTFRHVSRGGYSAEQLLLQLWRQLLHRRALLLQRSEVRLAVISHVQREEIEKGWARAGQLLFRLKELFVVGHSIAKANQEAKMYEQREKIASAAETGALEDLLDLTEAEEEAQTPRPEEVVERRRKQLEREAPWLFYEEKHKREKQQAEAAAATKAAKEKAAAPSPEDAKKVPPERAEAKEKVATEKAPAEKAATEKAPAEKAATEKAPAEKAATEKAETKKGAPGGPPMSKKAMLAKGPPKKTGDEKIPSEKAEAKEKVATEKAPAEKAAPAGGPPMSKKAMLAKGPPKKT